jgi:hypothetical protein
MPEQYLHLKNNIYTWYRMITVGDKTFTSQKKLHTYVKEWFDKVGFCNSVKESNMQLYEFLVLLVKRYPDRVLPYIDFSIQPNHMNRCAYELRIIEPDGNTFPISWVKCVSGRPDSPKSLLRSAMRTCISPQIVAYRSTINECHESWDKVSNTYICSICDKPTWKTHIDHVVHFEKIAQDFLDQWNGSVPCGFQSEPNTNRTMFKESDSVFSNAFAEYHFDKAILRITCVSCNLSREKS